MAIKRVSSSPQLDALCLWPDICLNERSVLAVKLLTHRSRPDQIRPDPQTKQTAVNPSQNDPDLAPYFSQHDVYWTEQLQQSYGVGCDKDIDAFRLNQRKKEDLNSACYHTCTRICCNTMNLQILLQLILYSNFYN